MKKLMITMALVGLVALPAAASPLFPSSIARVATPSDDIVQVKKKSKHYKWSPGRKVGWRGRGMPPGQYKKYYRR
jgi:hypothetical protein